MGEQLRVTVDRIEGHSAVLLFDEIELRSKEPQSVTIPLKSLPKSAKEGTVFVVEFLEESTATNRRDATARKLLEDILNGK